MSATFIAPSVTDEAALRFMLTVTAEGQTVSDEVTVSIVTSAPEVHADDGQLPFDPVDATDALQRAIDSGAPTVVVPYTGQPWIVRPLKLRSDLRLELEPGVVLEAKRSAFRGTNDSLARESTRSCST